MDTRQLPSDIIREILLFSNSRKDLIRNEILNKCEGRYMAHHIDWVETVTSTNKVYTFSTSKLFNPLQQMLVSTETLSFNSYSDIINYVNACGYSPTNGGYTAYIYIPQRILIMEYLT
jgi:hypothetical protein